MFALFAYREPYITLYISQELPKSTNVYSIKIRIFKPKMVTNLQKYVLFTKIKCVENTHYIRKKYEFWFVG